MITNPFELARQNQARLAQQNNDNLSNLESNSAVCNETAGVCPKCGHSMDTTTIGRINPEPVFWCGDCKVSTPKPRT